MSNSPTSYDIILYLFVFVIAVTVIATMVMWVKLNSKKNIALKQNIVVHANKNSSILKKVEKQIETLKREEVQEDISTNKVIYTDNNFQPLANETTYPKTQQNHIFQCNFDNKSLFETEESKIFYMTKPVENYFPVSAKSNSPFETVYKFTVNTNNNITTYEVHTLGAPVSEIIKRSQTYLMAGCDEDNISDSYTKTIRTLSPGTVKLENNKWIITKKALIRYE